MCHSDDARPPLPPGARQVQPGKPVTLTARDGNRLLGWRAAVPGDEAVVILPDVRGLHPYYQRLAEHFASVGIDAIAIDYFGRTAGTGTRPPDFDHTPHVQQTTYAGVNADVAAGVAHLREAGKQHIFTVGFCFGGSYSFMQAARPELELGGVIGFYGGMRPRSEGAPTPITLAPQAQVPALGLFGGADRSIPPEKLQEFQAGLERSGVAYTIQVYAGAPHSFFDRSFAEHADECADAWRRVLAFVTGQQHYLT